jgi:hypothetical protein
VGSESPDSFAVVNLDVDPAEIRWIEAPTAAGVAALAGATLAAAAATARSGVRAMLPDVEHVRAGLTAAGFDLETRMVIYQAPADTTW